MATKIKQPPADQLSKIEEGIKFLLDKLDFQTENVLEASTGNPVLFRLAIDYRLECLKARNIAKMRREQKRAEEELVIREEARNNGEKATERYIDTQLLLNSNIQQYEEAYSRAEEMEEYSKLVIEAVRMRRDSLRIVGDLVNTDLSIGRAVEASREKLNETRQQLKRKFPGSN